MGLQTTYWTRATKKIEVPGNEFNLGSYHTMAFQDGKIIGGGDWFDLTGFVQESTKPVMTE